MAGIDRIPPLPLAAVKSLEMLPCPWCGRHDYYDFLCGHDDLACKSCGRTFELLPGAVDDGPVTQGIRSAADLKYMMSLAITEEMVEAHHKPQGSGEAP